MALEDDDDRAAMIEMDPTTARWSYTSDDVDGIFDRAYVDPLGEFEGRTPVFHARESDFDDVAQGQTLTINSTVYTIAEVRPDGTGWVMLRLRG